MEHVEEAASLAFGRSAIGSERCGADLAEPRSPLLGSRALTCQEGVDLAQPPLLHPRLEMVEDWHGGAPVSRHRHGCVSYATDGRWAYGTASIDDRAAGSLEAAAERVYAEIFEALAASGCTQVQRFWNYMADINDASSGLERYRQFNIGRQRAFVSAQRSAFHGAPAACAMGTRQGPLTVHFLAGRTAPRMVENPRQLSAYAYPDRYGPRSPTFSRAAVVDVGGGREALFISGTASILGHETVHIGDVRLQTEETLDNIEAVLQATPGRAHRAEDLCFTVYVRHPHDLAVVQDVFNARLGGHSAAVREAVYLRADICRAELLVEIEAQSIVAREDRA